MSAAALVGGEDGGHSEEDEVVVVVVRVVLSKVRRLGQGLIFADGLVEEALPASAWCQRQDDESLPFDGGGGLLSALARDRSSWRKNERGVSLSVAVGLVGKVAEFILSARFFGPGLVFPAHMREMGERDEVLLALFKVEDLEGVNGVNKQLFASCGWRPVAISAARLAESRAAQSVWVDPARRLEPCVARAAKRSRQLSPEDQEAVGAAARPCKSASSVTPLCKFWLYNGVCSLRPSAATDGVAAATSSPAKGADGPCKFRHEALDEAEEGRIARLREKRASTLSRHAEEGATYNAEDGHGADTKEGKSLRSRLFAKWLVDTFGLDCMRSGSGVLDIAGGKGQNCVELLLLASQSAGVTAGAAGARTAVKQEEGEEREAVAAAELPEDLADISTTVVDPFKRVCALPKRTLKLLKRAGCRPPHYLHEALDDAFFHDAKRAALFKQAGLVVGMHPDQATGAIVQHAVKHRRPFALVPCCVFARDFPERLTCGSGEQGEPPHTVRTLNELLDWIRAHHDKMRVGFLPFQGRNKVLYMLAEDYDSAPTSVDSGC